MLGVSITCFSSCYSCTEQLTNDKSEFKIMVFLVLKDFNIVEKIKKYTPLYQEKLIPIASFHVIIKLFPRVVFFLLQ